MHRPSRGDVDDDNLTLLCAAHHLIVHRDNYTADITANTVVWRHEAGPPP